MCIRDSAAGGQADVAHADVHPVGAGNDGEKIHHIVEVVQRLADAHEHDVADALADVLLGGVDLPCYLPCFQVAHPARLGGGAEAAAHAAAHLAGHACGDAVVVAHDDRLDAVAVLKGEEVLHRAVLGLLPPHDGGGGDVIFLFQLGQQGLGLVGHGGKLRDQLLMQPVEYLFGPEGGLAQLLHQSGQPFERIGGYTVLAHCITNPRSFPYPGVHTRSSTAAKNPSGPAKPGSMVCILSSMSAPSSTTGGGRRRKPGVFSKKARTTCPFSRSSIVQVE